jgi:hypothetical protein
MAGRAGLIRRVLQRLLPFGTRFPGSAAYWENRYQSGRDSGQGSYGELARFKAATLNTIVRERGITSVIEFGCGDGNQLSLAEYPAYIGLDVAATAIKTCIRKFDSDPTKSFFLYNSAAFRDRHRRLSADAALSLDVILHLVEDAVYDAYMRDLFAAANRFVIIYSSNESRVFTQAHVRHREFTGWVSEHAIDWQLAEQVKNPLKSDDTEAGRSRADFFIYERRSVG